jgi:hypothetical protein
MVLLGSPQRGCRGRFQYEDLHEVHITGSGVIHFPFSRTGLGSHTAPHRSQVHSKASSLTVLVAIVGKAKAPAGVRGTWLTLSLPDYFATVGTA